MTDPALLLLCGASLCNVLLVLYLGYKTKYRFGKLDHSLNHLAKQGASRETELRDRLGRMTSKLEARLSAEMQQVRRGLGEDFKSQRLFLRKELRGHHEQVSKVSRAVHRVSKKLVEVMDGQIDLALQTSLQVLPLSYPVQGSPWSINGFLGRALVDAVLENRPRVIVELGSGASTVLIAAALERLGLHSTRHIAVDHLQQYLDSTRAKLQAQGLRRSTELWLCPLVEIAATRSIETNESIPWYHGIVNKLGDTKIDILLVDGPPGKNHPLSRRPALDILREHLSLGALVFLDDAKRKNEQATLQSWQRFYPEIEVVVSGDSKGYARVAMPPELPTRSSQE